MCIASLNKFPEEKEQSSEKVFFSTEFSKSTDFNKKDFFSEIGEIHIDSSYLEELRFASL